MKVLAHVHVFVYFYLHVAAGNPVYGVPQWLQDEVATTNAVLEADRYCSTHVCVCGHAYVWVESVYSIHLHLIVYQLHSLLYKITST